MSADRETAGAADQAFALLQQLLPLRFLSRTMHRLARSRRPAVRKAMIRAVLRSYPQIDMREAAEADPYAYESFNAFFTRALRPGARTVASGADEVVCPVDGTVSRFGRIEAGLLLQAKGFHYAVDALLADAAAGPRYARGSFACLYLAPYNYHRIHMPCDGRLLATRYVPGEFFSVNAATARTIPNLFTRNERVVCEFATALGPMAMVMVGALFVGSIETTFAGEINPPPRRGGSVRAIADGTGRDFRRGEEIGRFNMGSTVVVVFAGEANFGAELAPGKAVRLGQALARMS